MIKNIQFAILGFTSILVASTCAAAPIIYSGTDAGANSIDPRPNANAAAASFDTAAGMLGAMSLVDFESAPLGGVSNLLIAPGVTINGSNASIVNSATGSPDRLYGYNTTSGGSNFVSLYGGNLIFTFSDPVQAFGAYISGVQVDGLTLSYSDGVTEMIGIPNLGSGVSFLGFTDAGKSIVSVTYTVKNDIVGVDDVRFGPTATAEVPEPASLALWSILGATGIAAWRRKRKVVTA